MLGEGIILFAEYAAKAIGLSFARLILSFNRDATKTFWYTFDADDNRNISRYQQNKRWSFSIFSLSPTIYAAYDATIHGVRAYAFHGADRRWVELEDHAGAVFPGPNVRRDVTKFVDSNPPFAQAQLHEKQSATVRVSKLGIFDYALSSEFALPSTNWPEGDFGDYVPLAVILNINTKYVCVTCLVPEMTGSHAVPAYFVGQPTIYKTNDVAAMLERATGELANAEQLGRAERTTIWWKIS